MPSLNICVPKPAEDIWQILPCFVFLLVFFIYSYFLNTHISSFPGFMDRGWVEVLKVTPPSVEVTTLSGAWKCELLVFKQTIKFLLNFLNMRRIVSMRNHFYKNIKKNLFIIIYQCNSSYFHKNDFSSILV